MRPRTLIVLAALVAVLAAFIWFVERDLPGSDERTELARRLFDFEPEAVSAVVIERGGERVRLERAADSAGPAVAGDASAEEPAPELPGRWRLVEPLAAPADGGEVDDLLTDLAELERERVLEGSDRAEVGLDLPRAKVTVELAGGTRTLEIGGEVPASSNMVVAADDGTIYVVPDLVWSALDRPPGDWRSREVFEFEREAIERVRLSGSGEPLLLARRGETFWIESPEVDRAHDDRVSELLGDLVALEVEAFVDTPPGPPAELGLDPAAAAVEVVVSGREQPLLLELGDRVEDGEGRYARLGDRLFELGDDLEEALERPLEGWRSDAWTSLESWEVDRVIAIEGGDSLTLERSGGDWKRGEESLEYGPVSDLLYAVTGAAAERLVARSEVAAEAALDDVSLEITLVGDDREEIVRLHGAVAGGFLASTEGRDRLLVLSAEAVDDLRAKLAAVREAEPEPAEAETEAAEDSETGA